jgi:hypothetical protein
LFKFRLALEADLLPAALLITADQIAVDSR